MGRVRTKTVKKASKILIEKYYGRLGLDFHTNKRIVSDVALVPSKPLRNKIAGFVTHLMKRLRHKTVRGISIKLQQEERERRDNFVPERSVLEKEFDGEGIEVDEVTMQMMKELYDPGNMPNNHDGIPISQDERDKKNRAVIKKHQPAPHNKRTPPNQERTYPSTTDESWDNM